MHHPVATVHPWQMSSGAGILSWRQAHGQSSMVAPHCAGTRLHPWRMSPGVSSVVLADTSRHVRPTARCAPRALQGCAASQSPPRAVYVTLGHTTRQVPSNALASPWQPPSISPPGISWGLASPQQPLGKSPATLLGPQQVPNKHPARGWQVTC